MQGALRLELRLQGGFDLATFALFGSTGEDHGHNDHEYGQHAEVSGGRHHRVDLGEEARQDVADEEGAEEEAGELALYVLGSFRVGEVQPHDGDAQLGQGLMAWNMSGSKT